MRLHASGVCHSDQNAIDGTAETRCPAVLGHEGAGVVEAIGPGVRRVAVGDHVALSWAPSCGDCTECLRELAAAVLDGVARDGPRRTARRDDAALARRRAGLPLLLHLVVRGGDSCCRSARASRSRPTCPSTSRGSSAARSRPGSVPSGGPPACGPATVSRSSAAAASACRRSWRRSPSARRRSSRSTSARGSSPFAAELRRHRRRSRGRASPEETADAVARGSGGGVDYAIEATGRTEAMLAAFLSTRARGAAVLIGIPRADAIAAAAGALDPADGAPRARVDLRFDLPGARLRADARPLPPRPAAARPADHAPAAARGARARASTCCAPARRSAPSSTSAERRRDDGGSSSTAGSAQGWGGVEPEREPRQRRARDARQPDGRGGAQHVRPPVPGPHAGAWSASAERQVDYEPIWPPTLMMNKSTALEEHACRRSPGARRSSASARACSTPSPTA